MLDRELPPSSFSGQSRPIAGMRANLFSDVLPDVSQTVSSANSANSASSAPSGSPYPEAVNSGSVSAAGMVLQMADGQIAACNANAERMMGITAAQMTGWRSTSPDWRVVREDGTPFPGEDHPAMMALRTGKPCRDVVMGFYQPDGRLVWLLLNSQPLFQDSTAQPYAVLTTLTEIPQQCELVSAPDPSRQLPQTTFQVQSTLSLLIAENQALRDSEERLRLALEGADLGLWDYDLEAQQLVWSDRCKTLFGVSRNTPITYDRFLETVHPDDRTAIHGAIQQVIQGSANGNADSAYDLEIRLNDRPPLSPESPAASDSFWQKQGARWMRLKGNVYRNAAGQLHRMVGIAIDITHRKWAERNLAESQSRFQAFMDNSPALALIKDEASRLLYMNHAGYDLFEELPLNQTDFEYLPEAVARQNCEHDRQVLETHQTLRTIETIPDRTGITRSWLVFKFPLPTANGERLIGGMGIDITERKQIEEKLLQSEERYRCLAECVPQLIWTADAAGGLDDLNQRWSDYTGLSLEQARGAGWLQTVHPDDAPMLTQFWLQAQKTRSLYQTECRIRSAAGDYRWFLVKAMPVQDEAGNVLKWYGTSTDIQDQKQLVLERLRALELEQAARSEAEKANRIKDELLMMLSHELRTPLNPILGWSQLLQRWELSREKTIAALVTIERNAQRQLQLVEDLLDVAKLLRGGIQLKQSAVNLREPISGAIASIRTMADAKQIELEISIEPGIPVVYGDPVRLQQIAWNLLSNAVKFTPEGGKVTVRLSHGPAAVQLQVSDTGTGIEPDFLPHVFDLFRQSNSSTTRQYGGLGLGLTIVRHLVQLHGGTIEAESSENHQGATFTVQFPLTPVSLP